MRVYCAGVVWAMDRSTARWWWASTTPCCSSADASRRPTHFANGCTRATELRAPKVNWCERTACARRAIAAKPSSTCKSSSSAPPVTSSVGWVSSRGKQKWPSVPPRQSLAIWRQRNRGNFKLCRLPLGSKRGISGQCHPHAASAHISGEIRLLAVERKRRRYQRCRAAEKRGFFSGIQ